MKKIILSTGVLVLISLIVINGIYQRRRPKPKVLYCIDLPEEISQASTGDTLVISTKGDLETVGFYHGMLDAGECLVIVK